jgi:polar amino acid transport system substrate-binding protein
MKKVLALVLAVSLLLGVVSIAGAAGEQKSKLQEVLERGYLIVGTGSTNVPWHSLNVNGEYEGFDIDMGRILAKGLFGDPSKVQFVEQASDQRIPNTLANKVDITFQFMTISPARAQQVAFSIPYYTEGIGLILKTGGTYKSYDELTAAIAAGKKVVVAVLQNADAAETVQEMLPGSQDDQYESQGLVYQAVDSGRADAGAVDLSSILWLASQQPEKYTDSGFGTHPQNYGAAMNPNDQVWINFVNQVLLDAMTGATYKLYADAFVKWFGVLPQAPAVGMPSMYRSK